MRCSTTNEMHATAGLKPSAKTANLEQSTILLLKPVHADLVAHDKRQKSCGSRERNHCSDRMTLAKLEFTMGR